ncbi:TYRO protein tyrosine kinase-binding protein isoform X2 [Alligator sinensis]|uniref:TYRO protein tyrosine kinase-binding protein n=1 Tax=Alligator sinensis TaxID=38654 RepID=A0A1U7RM76_ALLSI|nr:TYRO protein tyrosine kinase-binding protein isoform X2 [Alligator sinensis]
MEPPEHALLGALLAWALLGSVQGQQGCGGCPALGGGALAGLVLGDLVLTLLIALAVYCLATRCRLPSSSGDVKKPCAPEVESPYQELQGQRTEIYSDLKGPGAAGK